MRYAARVTLNLRDELRGLLDLARAAWPVTAQQVRDHLAPRAAAITTSNANLEHPPWADRVGSRDDVFIELGGDVAGVGLPASARGGQYADLYVARGTLADVEAVAGPLSASPMLQPGSPARAVAYPEIGGHRLRVLTETDHQRRLRRVSVHYEQ